MLAGVLTINDNDQVRYRSGRERKKKPKTRILNVNLAMYIDRWNGHWT